MISGWECYNWLDQKRKEGILTYQKLATGNTFHVTLKEHAEFRITIGVIHNEIKVQIIKGPDGNPAHEFYIQGFSAEKILSYIIDAVQMSNNCRVLPQGTNAIHNTIHTIFSYTLGPYSFMELPLKRISILAEGALGKWGPITVWDFAKKLPQLLAKNRTTILAPKFDLKLSDVDLYIVDEQCEDLRYVANIIDLMNEIGDKLREDGIPEGSFTDVIDSTYEQVRREKVEAELGGILAALGNEKNFDPQWGKQLIVPHKC